MNFKIVFEDEQILIIEKPAGLVVNRSQTIKEETLQDQLARYFHLGSSPGIGERAGIVHRLDRETSGLMLVAKTSRAFDFLQKEFVQREVNKEYIALVHGLLKERSGMINNPLGRIKFGKFGVTKSGRQAITAYQVENYFRLKYLNNTGVLVQTQTAQITKARVNYLRHHAGDYTLLRLHPKTGRTHQVRVHLKSIGNPIVSDSIYAPRKLLQFDLTWCPRLFLHAAAIEFIHPKTKKYVSFKSDLPKDLKNAMLNLATSD